MITDLVEKSSGGGFSYREGKVPCKPWGTEIPVFLFDETVTLEYAEKCAEAMNDMPGELLDAICRAAKLFCLEFCDEICDEWREELNLAVPVDEDTPPAELMKCFTPTGLVVMEPEDPTRIGYQLECACDWEEEHGMEIDILDDKLVFLSEYCGESPWGDHSDDMGNYATDISGVSDSQEGTV